MNNKTVLCVGPHPDDAEGFRQHLGLNYPTENILKSELASYVYEIPISE